MKKTQTIDEYCDQPPGTFARFLEKQDAEFKEMEEDRKRRIRDHNLPSIPPDGDEQ